jgi:excisionase family DNA binding protein
MTRLVSRISGSRMGTRPVTQLRTVAQTAELLGTSTRTIHRLIQSHALPVHRLGRLVRVSDADIAAFLAATRSV